MKQFTYLFLLNKPDYAAAHEAANFSLQTGARVLAQTGAEAMEISATPEQADTIMTSGYFSHKTRKPIPASLLQKLPEAQQPVVTRWNARQGRDYKLRQREARQHTHAHQHELKHGAPYSPVDIRWLEEQVRKGIERSTIQPDVQLISIMPDLATIEPTHFHQLRKRMQEYLQNETQSRHLAIAFYRASAVMQKWLLNPGVLKALKELNLLDQQGCRKMFGTFSVGVVFVESDRERVLWFSIAERDEILNKIQEGLTFLVNQHPSGNLKWVFDSQVTKIDVPNQPNRNNADIDFDAYWRDPSIADINFMGKTYPKGDKGRQMYQRDLKAAHLSDAAFTIFVTKYGCS